MLSTRLEEPRDVAGVVGINVKFGADVESRGAGMGFRARKTGVDVIGGIEGSASEGDRGDVVARGGHLLPGGGRSF